MRALLPLVLLGLLAPQQAGGVLELPLLGAAECFASPTCRTYSFSDTSRAVLNHESRPVMAHFIAGQVGSPAAPGRCPSSHLPSSRRAPSRASRCTRA
jgi:hypothetical protein